MDVVVARCAGLDVGKRELVACVRVPADGARAGTVLGSRRQVIKKFATFTGSLRRLAGWLAEHGVTEVVMEATGQYWKPVWYALEDHGGFELKLVNAQHVWFLPGRKTDVADAAWLAELLEHGLLRGSFVPPAPIRELRDLTRYRKKLIQAHTAESQRVSKTLEDAGIKLDSVASDVLGVSGRAMLGALLAGERDPAVLAELAKGRLRAKIPILVEALTGRFGAHHAVLLGLSLDHLQHLEQAVATLDEQIDAVMTPFAAARDHLDSIPRGGQTGRGEPDRRDRGRHGRVPHRGPPGVLGVHVPRQQHHRRQTTLGQDPPRQSLAARRPGRGRLGGQPHQKHRPGRPVLAPGPADRQEEGRRGRRPQHPPRRLVDDHQRRRLPRPRPRPLPPPPRQHRPPPRPRPARPARPGLPRHPRPGSLTKTTRAPSAAVDSPDSRKTSYSSSFCSHAEGTQRAAEA